MTDACREVEAAELQPPVDPQLAARIAAHLTHCTACQTRSADHARLAAALRVEPAAPDELARARWLAQMAPAIDDLATRHAGRDRAPRRLWLPLVAVAAAGLIAIWFAGRGGHESRVASLEVLRPYVVGGATSEAAATTLLAGRFSALEVSAGELVRASVDGGGRIALVGHARVTVVAVEPALELELVEGTLLVETTRPIRVHGPGFDLRTQDASFAVSAEHGPVGFVDRATVELGDARVVAGEWWGPTAGRSAALVASLRDHAHAIPAPGEPSGVLAIAGPPAVVVTESGGVLGTAPLWARVTVGPLVVVVAGEPEQRVAIEVTSRGLARVPRAAVITAATAPHEPMIAPGAIDPHPGATVDPRSGEPQTSAPRTSAPGIDPRLGAPTAIDPRAAKIDPRPTGSEPNAASGAEVESASQLYADAERRLGGGDRAGAEQVLVHLVDRFPDAAQAASALYDLATLARARGDLPAARDALDRLRASPSTALREPAAYLRCRLDVDAKLDAAACFRAFRRDFASSAHDAEVLAWLVGHAAASEGCAAARGLAGEYLQRYPTGGFAGHAREVAACTP